jgi:hypothetical protein
METRAAALFCLIVVLGACADGAGKPGITRPELAPSLNVTEPAEGDVPDAAEAGDIMALSADAEAEAGNAATGGRASGHADVLRVFTPTLSTAYKYSFIALATEPTPAEPRAGKGELQATIVRTVGAVTVTETIHADVDCVNFVNIPIPILGRLANVSGPIKKWTRDGQPVAFPPGQEVLFTVQDNGEGRDSPPDRASIVEPVGGRQNCRFLLILPQPSEQGNIQVRFPGEKGND